MKNENLREGAAGVEPALSVRLMGHPRKALLTRHWPLPPRAPATELRPRVWGRAILADRRPRVHEKNSREPSAGDAGERPGLHAPWFPSRTPFTLTYVHSKSSCMGSLLPPLRGGRGTRSRRAPRGPTHRAGPVNAFLWPSARNPRRAASPRGAGRGSPRGGRRPLKMCQSFTKTYLNLLQ